MSPIVTLIADLLVAGLLAATIASSVALGRRITGLKADEASMRRATGELVRATESAERAIAGLRSTLGECDKTLGERLRAAERSSTELASQVQAGAAMIARVSRIVEAGRKAALVGDEPGGAEPAPGAQPSPTPHKLEAAAAAASALSGRMQRRLGTRAA